MPYSLLTSPKTAVDAVWFDRLYQICDHLPEVYSLLGPDQASLEKLRIDFTASHYSATPDLRPANVPIERYETVNAALAQLRGDLEANEKNQAVREAYKLRIDELVDHHNLLISACKNDSDAFTRLNESLYGVPDSKIFNAVCAWIRQTAANVPADSSQQLKEAAEAALSHIPDLAGDTSLILPDTDTFAATRKLHMQPRGYFEQLFQDIKLETTINNQTGEKILKQVLSNLHNDYSLQDADVFWGVSHAAKAVYRPASYTLPRLQFSGIVAHEFGSHLLEYVNGSRQPLRLLATGLDHYDHSNEGRAYLREQIVYSDLATALSEPSWEHIITLHLAISLAYGLHDHPCSFGEVYAVIVSVGQLLQLLRNPLANVADTAHEQAWVTVTRVLKGTNGSSAYLKDIMYLEGNARCWQIAKQKPEHILMADLGKFDIARPDHLNLLQAFGVLPSDS